MGRVTPPQLLMKTIDKTRLLSYQQDLANQLAALEAQATMVKGALQLTQQLIEELEEKEADGQNNP